MKMTVSCHFSRSHCHVERSRDIFNNMIISLTGFMGCGKSSVGRKLSELLCCRFMDLDDCIVEEAGCSIPEIFAKQGEPAFRKLEQEVLKNIVSVNSEDNIVLALGGGAVMTSGSEDIVHEGTICIYLKASVDTLIEHLTGETAGRPMLNQQTVMSSESETSPLRARILELMSLRAATYERTAHHTIDTDGKTVEEIAATIVQAIK